MEPESDPVALRPDFYRSGAAWKALYGFNTPPPLNANGLKLLNDARLKDRAIHGEHYPEWVLHQATIGTMLARSCSQSDKAHGIGAGIGVVNSHRVTLPE
jgi:hypothetical protein